METLKWSRWKQIYYTGKEGRAYFMHYGRRYHLGEFMRTNRPFDNNNDDYHGYMVLTNFHSMLIRISNYGEAVKIAYTGGES